MQMQGQQRTYTKHYQHYQRGYQYNIGNQLPNQMLGQMQNKFSHSPGQWKKYMPNQTHLKVPMRRQHSAYLKTNNVQSNISYVTRDQGVSTFQQNPSKKLQQQKRRKQEMMRRVEQIERKVMPILKSQHPNQEFDQNFAWNNKIEQKLLKLQTKLDMIEKQMEIKIQRRLLEVQKQWNARIQALMESSPHKKITRDASKKLSKKPKVNGFHHQISPQQRHKNQYQKYNTQNKEIIGKNQGFFTKREQQELDDQQYDQNQIKSKR